MKEYIDYSTLNLAIDLKVGGQSYTVHCLPPKENEVNMIAISLGQYFEFLSENLQKVPVISRDWKHYYSSITEKAAEFAGNKDEFISQQVRYVAEILDRAINSAYVIDNGQCERLIESELYKYNPLMETLKGMILFFIALVRYSIGVMDNDLINSLGCVYTSLNATDYASSLLKPAEKKETSGETASTTAETESKKKRSAETLSAKS